MSTYGTVDNIKKTWLRGRTGTSYRFKDDAEFDDFLQGLLDGLNPRVNAILPQGELDASDKLYPAVVEVVERRVAGAIPMLTQIDNTDIIRINDFTVQVLNTAKLWEGLSDELLELFDTSLSDDITMFTTGGLGL